MKYANLIPDKKIENYVWNHQAQIGSGAFGKIYLGHDTKKGPKDNLVAIKVIEKNNIKDQYLQQCLNNEVTIMSKMKGKNTIGLLDYLHSSSRIYIIEIFCNGGDFRTLLTKRQRIEEMEAKHILQDILNGIYELCQQNIIHRDLKPENILIHDGVYKLADFGFSSLAQANEMKTTVCGTPLYMSPQLLKNEPYTTKSDVWSIGIIYYEMLFGTTPWPSRSQYELIKNIKKIPLQFQEGVLVSKESKDFLKRCLQLEEKNRISWEEIFNHPIFQKNLTYESKIELNSSLKQLISELQDIIIATNANINQLFDNFDKEKKGLLNLKQFTELIKAINYKLDTRAIEAIFKQFDINGDQSISKDEFNNLIMETNYTAPQNNKNDLLIEQRTNKLIKKLRDIINTNNLKIEKIFAKFDKSGDQELQFPEFFPILKNEAEYIFKKFDEDGNGSITLDEFANVIYQKSGKANEASANANPIQFSQQFSSKIKNTIMDLRRIIEDNQLEISMIFSSFDTDRSGTLEIDEFTSLIQVINANLTEQEIKEIFAAFDQDSSGSLDLKEFDKILKI